MIYVNVQSMGDQILCAEYNPGTRRGVGEPVISGRVIYEKRETSRCILQKSTVILCG